MSIRERVAALLGVSTFAAPSLDAAWAPPQDVVDDIRESFGGQLALIPQSQTRWYLRDLEAAEHAADSGDLSQAARLMRAARKDGVYAGVLSTRTGGLVRLPKRFRGTPELVDGLKQGSEETRGIFDEMCPATELGLFAADGLELGVAVGELVPVVGRDFPVFVRLDPEFLWYRWNENRWYYRSIAGMLPITPGDGRWVLHMPGGRVGPWQHGLWRAVGRAYIRKEHALFHADNWEAKLANPARVAVAPQGAAQEQKDTWFRAVMAWGVNTVFGMTPGYDVKLLESNGRGWQAFKDTVADCNNEFVIAVAGQTVTTDGGAGFSNSDVHKSIRADLIKETAEGLAHTINTQVLPAWIIDSFGEDALAPGVVVEWDVTPPKDRNSEASAMQMTAQAMEQLTKSLAAHGLKLDARALAISFGIPTIDTEAEGADAQPLALLFDVSLQAALDLAKSTGLRPTAEAVRRIVEGAGVALEEQPTDNVAPRDLDLAQSDVARVVRASEARASQGLPPFGDERDDKTVAQLGEEAKFDSKAEGDVAVVKAEDAADDDNEQPADDSVDEAKVA